MFGDSVTVNDLTLWRTIVDVGLVALLLYQLLRLLRGTRSGAVLIGVALLFGLFFLSQDSVFDLPTVNWVLDRFIGSVAVLLVVLFQDDIRRAFSNLLRSPWSSLTQGKGDSAVVSEVMRAATVMSQRGIGALIVIEREAPLDRFAEQGVRVDARVGWQLLLSLFIPSHMNPTHDGAVIISNGRVAAAACFLPLAQGDDLPSQIGSRHRAALGLADETDAIVVVVSEETGQCGLAHLAQLDVDLRPSDLRERLEAIMGQTEPAHPPRRWRRRILPRGTLGKAGRVTGEFRFESIRAALRSGEKAPEPESSKTDESSEVSPVERVAQLAVVGVEQQEEGSSSVEEAS
ncbi:MAG TPA: TIGR00159 family protein [Myxococcales bacterium]|nr:TIGR00159 family protein [Myxococcales bacterium]HAN30482.1 TIGR00159 family protein [Myxococcales bacterium]